MTHFAPMLLAFSFCMADIDDQRPTTTKNENQKVYDEIINRLIHQATAPSPGLIHSLRTHGPEAFERLLEVLDERRPTDSPTADQLRELRSPTPFIPSTSRRISEAATVGAKRDTKRPFDEPMDHLIDQVAGQRYATVSRLFWFDSDSSAKDYASRVHRPIVSLRLLGKLTDEYSCANSRFFRTLLYPDPDVNHLLKDRAVLAWESVRPVPRITIDFGDGRRIEQTVTGNSIHYIMDERGRLVDAIPGLYSPNEFASALTAALGLAEQAAPLPQREFESLIREYHSRRVEATKQRFKEALTSIRDRSKIAGWILDANMMDDLQQVEAMLPTETWELLAETEHVQFLWPAQVFIRVMQPNDALAAGKLAVPKSGGEFPMLRMMAALGKTVGADTWQNELVLRRKISELFISGGFVSDLPFFNEQVYSKVFLTPSSDPWLGLVNPNTFTALPASGVIHHAETVGGVIQTNTTPTTD